MRIAVLGAGGVGGFLAAALTRAGHDVVVIAREQTVAAVRRDGLTIASQMLGDLHERPRAETALIGDVDALLVTVKATGLAPALLRIAGRPPLVVPQLNGLDHLAVLRERFGDAVVPATIRIEATRVAPTTIEQTGANLLVEVAGAPQLAAALEQAGIPSRVCDSAADMMWRKLVRLNALALTTTAFDAALGEIREDPDQRAALIAAVHETAATGAADGAYVDPLVTEAELLVHAHPELRSSMARDVQAGREPELDAIAGAVLRRAARHAVPVPTVASLTALIARRTGIAVDSGAA
jgi:2-dehydropantoate 2-reductase